MALDALKARIPRPLLRLAAAAISPAQHFGEFALDAARYLRVSSGRDGVVTARSNSDQFEAQLTKDYHRVEKGLALPAPKRPFGAKVQTRLEALLPAAEASHLRDEPFVRYARTALESLQAWNAGDDPRDTVSPIVPLDAGLDATQLATFFQTRRSVRNFVPAEDLEQKVALAASLATNTPSVCNRQAGRVHLFTQGEDVQRILAHQNGNAGFRQTVPAVAIITVDTRLFTGVTERHQRYIDGGLFAMSFGWALHGVGLASCMLNWSMNNAASARLRRAAQLEDHEDILMMIAIGAPAPGARVARSPRRGREAVLINHVGSSKNVVGA